MNISIIIPVYNSSLTLKECLDAIFDTNFKNFEVIIVSDNSSDNSVEIAKQYQCKVPHLQEIVGLKRQKEIYYFLLTQMF